MEFIWTDRVREIAAEKGISLNKLEANAEMTKGRLWAAMKCDNPAYFTIVRICKALGVSVAEFYSTAK